MNRDGIVYDDPHGVIAQNRKAALDNVRSIMHLHDMRDPECAYALALFARAVCLLDDARCPISPGLDDGSKGGKKGSRALPPMRFAWILRAMTDSADKALRQALQAGNAKRDAMAVGIVGGVVITDIVEQQRDPYGRFEDGVPSGHLEAKLRDAIG